MRQIPNRLIHKTANYTINPAVDRPGTLFANGGATGTVDFTLPLPTRELLGFSYGIVGIADYAVGFVAQVADTLITKNDIAADSVKAQTAGEIIGARLEAVCVETARNSGVYQWVVSGVAVGHTYTVAS